MLVLVFAAHALLMSYFPRYLAEEQVITRLEHDNESLLERLEIKPGVAPVLRGNRVAPIYSIPMSGHYFQVTTASGVLRSPSLGGRDLALPAIRKTPASLHFDGPDGKPLLGLVLKYLRNGQVATIVFAEEIADINEDIGETRRIYFFGIAATVIIILLLQRWFIRRSLKPLEKARAELADIESGEASRIQQIVPREIQPLVNEINHLLEIMEKRLLQSRKAAGNLAHALKTPLAVLEQIAGSDEVRDQPGLADEIAHIGQSMKDSIRHELRRARIAGKATSGEHFHAAKEIPDLVAVMQKVHADKTLDIEQDPGGGDPIKVDREDMLELLGNLLDNACKWAVKRVRIVVSDQGFPVITIEDDGPGIDDSMLESLIQRGIRLDEKTPGHGLGLSIVTDIVNTYEGRLLFSRSEDLGGLKVRVEFPKN